MHRPGKCFEDYEDDNDNDDDDDDDDDDDGDDDDDWVPRLQRKSGVG